jgi:UDP-glucose 4-epimerase
MLKILITGANSFIGTNFRKYSKYKECEEVSLIDKNLDEIKFNKFDIVLHLAAIVHQSKKLETDEYFRINRDLCYNIARKAKSEGVTQFVFLSTLKVYGNCNSEDNLLSENSQCLPDDPYGRSKYEAELLLQKLSDSDFVVSIVRPSLVYGEGVKANMLRLITLVEKSCILPFGKIKNRRNYIYTENLVNMIDKIIEMRIPGVFIAVDPDAISTSDLVRSLAHEMGKRVYLFHIPGFLLYPIRLLFPEIISRLFDSSEYDNSQTLFRLRLNLPYSTEEGLKRTIDAYKKQKNN